MNKRKILLTLFKYGYEKGYGFLEVILDLDLDITFV